MFKKHEILMFLFVLFCLFVVVSSVSASNYYVDSATSHKDITDWMQNAKKGDNLIFNSDSYDLSDTLVVSKSVNIKSYVNTKIYFNKSVTMFDITGDSVYFSGLTLVHNPKENVSMPNYEMGYDDDSNPRYALNSISASSNTVKHINFKNMNIIADIDFRAYGFTDENSAVGSGRSVGINYHVIDITNWKGNVDNCVFNVNNGNIISSGNYVGNIRNSRFKSSYTDTESSALSFARFKGNILNSKFKSKGERCLDFYYFNGNIEKSEFYVNGCGCIYGIGWRGNIVGSKIKAVETDISAIKTGNYWIGTMYKSKVIAFGACALFQRGSRSKIAIKSSTLLSYVSTTLRSDGAPITISNSRIYGFLGLKDKNKQFPTAVEISKAKGSITESVIKQSCGYALRISKNIKVSNCKLSSKKGLPTVVRIK